MTEMQDLMKRYADLTNEHLNFPQGNPSKPYPVALDDEHWNAVVYALAITQATISASMWPKMPGFIHAQLHEAQEVIARESLIRLAFEAINRGDETLAGVEKAFRHNAPEDANELLAELRKRLGVGEDA